MKRGLLDMIYNRKSYGETVSLHMVKHGACLNIFPLKKINNHFFSLRFRFLFSGCLLCCFSMGDHSIRQFSCLQSEGREEIISQCLFYMQKIL